MEQMTGRERILTALRHGTPDRVPATPDISIMIPTRLLGKNFYDSYDITHAYINAARHFGIDGWMFNGTLHYRTESKVWYEHKVLRDTYDVKEYLTIAHTPDGDMRQRVIAPRTVPATTVEKFVKDFKADYKKIRHFFTPLKGYDRETYDEQRKLMGEQGMICCFVDCPGLQHYVGWMDIENLIYAYYDYPELFDELREIHDKICVQRMELAADAGVESILTGGSGSITLQSPDIFRKLSLPTLQKVTRIARQAGILSGVHSCGKEYDLLQMCHDETDLDYVNPIEIPPQGDCELPDIKRKFGGKLALMGNLHTSRVMLGSVELVRLAALKAIRDAGPGGGFVLSTGDQCGYNTDYENIYELVRVSKEYGAYPLDMDRIQGEITRLERKGVCMPS